MAYQHGFGGYFLTIGYLNVFVAVIISE